jgi:ABC-type bacteriocin/lantibiotic exporter with double-glycine peptidase domain
VCLARVVLKNPALLALDEATANLDEQTEKVFQKVLEEKFKDATILCVAHRLETLRWCRIKIEIGAGNLSISDLNVAQLPVLHPAHVHFSAPESSFQSHTS